MKDDAGPSELWVQSENYVTLLYSQNGATEVSGNELSLYSLNIQFDPRRDTGCPDLCPCVHTFTELVGVSPGVIYNSGFC